ncbi:cyclic nucleotide-binding domain-containing protein [Rapidithrix thailandica]|uniref:Cyclic nucleotide-binding domain-containing protein n=1 Tax=Rapidithrix thailandica TaxID=413964 RepID=A0AAW9SFV1_9BACT
MALFRNYIIKLRSLLPLPFTKGPQITIDPHRIQRLLLEKLESTQAPEVIYALDRLEQLGEHDLEGLIKTGLNHQDIEVKSHSIHKAVQLQLKKSTDLLLSLSHEKKIPAKVKEEAIIAYCKLSDDPSPVISPLLHASEMHIRKGALIGLMGYGNLQSQATAHTLLSDFLHSDKNEDKIVAAAALGEIKDSSYFNYLKNYLNDPSFKVRESAAHACGKWLHPHSIPFLLDQLRFKELHAVVSTALVNFKDQLLPYLHPYFVASSNERDKLFLSRLCHLCSQIGSTAAQELLFELIIHDEPWVELQEEVHLALQGTHFQTRSMEQLFRIHDHLERQFKQIHWLYSALHTLEKSKGAQLLSQALKIELKTLAKNRSILFSFINHTPSQKAAEESKKKLKNPDYSQLLPGHLSTKLNLLVEETSYQEKLHKLSHFYSVYLYDELSVITKILQDVQRQAFFNRWTLAVAAYSLAERCNPSMLPHFTNYLTSQDKLLVDSALFTLRKFCKRYGRTLPDIIHELLPKNPLAEKIIAMTESTTLLEIEKVLMLKSSRLFSKTPENVLVDVAKILEEIHISKGGKIFEKGEKGDCMYIIYQGEIKIHVGHYRLNTLVDRDFFGELGLLDANPRSATATAEKPSILLKLEQEAFYELIATRPEISQGVMQALSSLIRAQSEMLSNMQSGMAQS